MTITLDTKVSDAPTQSHRIDLMAKRLDTSKLNELSHYHIEKYLILQTRKDTQSLLECASLDEVLAALHHPDARILRLEGIAPQDYNNVVHVAQNLYKKTETH